MGRTAAEDGASAGPGGPTRLNLQEQLAWAEKAPKSVLQQCLNSHAISTYLDSRAAREQRVDKENCREVLQRGAEALRKLQAFGGGASGQLKVVPTPKVTPPPVVMRPRPALAALPPMAPPPSPATNRQAHTTPVQVQSRTSSFVDLTGSSDSRTGGSSKNTGYGGDDDDFDDSELFGALDVDALVASHQRQKTEPRRASVSASASTVVSMQLVQQGRQDYRSSAPTATNTNLVETLRRSIKETREKLRDVREECDDASLEGDVPYHLAARRAQLETELDTLSRRYRECKSGATPTGPSTPMRSTYEDARALSTPAAYSNDFGSSSMPASSQLNGSNDSGNPQCSCGLSTFQAKVKHGQNADRSYYRCSNCGFHSWADGNSSDTPSKRLYEAKDFVDDRPCVSRDENVNAKMQRAKRVLRDVFGHNAFRPNQERIVLEAFEGRDVFVLMPTGGGKSLCYQLPACVNDGVTIVISPLVSLIQDQVQQLEALDVGVANLNGEQDYETVQKPIISELFSSRNRIKLLYVTPEKIASSNTLNNIFDSLEKRGRLARFVIDEAHCISQWGHDFRKDYMNLGQLRGRFPSVPIMALTATANTQTEADIVKNLKLSNPFITRSSFNRPNLTYDVRKKTSKFMNEIADYVREHIDDSGIIYCLSKKDCEQTADKLIKALGFEGTRKANQISFYHAGLEPEDRAHRHHEWSRGKIKLIVATVAFGMGINKPDVRYVIHHTIPQSVTHYYQEAGRAGRDGDVANCILYYSFLDLSRRRKLITKDRENSKHRNVHLQNLRRMTEFCENQVECRRTSLLEYFGEHFSSADCHQTCDNCKNRAMGLTFEKTDITEDCLALMRMIKALQEDNEPSTLVQISQHFLGNVAKGREWKRDQFAQLPGYGSGKGRYQRSEVERILYHMVLRQYLREVDQSNKMGFTTTFLALGENAERLERGEKVRIVCKTKYKPRALPSDHASGETTTKKKSSKKKAKAADASDSANSTTKSRKKKKKAAVQEMVEYLSDDDFDNQPIMPPSTAPKAAQFSLMPPPKSAARIPEEHVDALIQLLKDWRASVCETFNKMPYHIIPNNGIALIANAVPTSNEELLEIEGVGRTRMLKYGDSILQIVKSYLDKHQLTPTPVVGGRRAGVLDSLESLDEVIDVDRPVPVKASPFFQSKAKQETAKQDTSTANGIQDDLDDFNWDAVDDAVLAHQSSKRAWNSNDTIDAKRPKF